MTVKVPHHCAIVLGRRQASLLRVAARQRAMFIGCTSQMVVEVYSTTLSRHAGDATDRDAFRCRPHGFIVAGIGAFLP